MSRSIDLPVSLRAGFASIASAALVFFLAVGHALSSDSQFASRDNVPISSASDADSESMSAAAAIGSGFTIDWQSIDGGATLATGGNYQLRGTVGQPDADAAHPSESIDFQHTGGFWTVLSGVGVSVQVLIFRDRFED